MKTRIISAIIFISALLMCTVSCSNGGKSLETHALGETVSTELIEFTLDRADPAIALRNTIDENYGLPKEYDASKDAKNPMVVAKGHSYIAFTFTAKNLDRSNLNLQLVDTFSDSEIEVIYNGKSYVVDDNFDGFKHCLKIDEDGNYDTHNYANVLLDAGEKSTIRAYVDIPCEIPDDASDFTIIFDLPDINDTFVKYAYKVTAEDRAAAIAAEEAAANERRKQEEEALAAELAEIKPALAEEIKKQLVGEWEYTDENKVSYVFNINKDNTIAVTMTVAGSSIHNNGTYSIRKEAVLVEYVNGGKAKMPYTYANGELTIYPIVGIK